MNKQSKYAIRILHEQAYSDEQPFNDYSPEFMNAYYSKQAALDLLELVMDNKQRCPVDIVEEYRNKMDRYSLMDHPGSIIYSIKYDYATYVLDRLIA